MAFPRDEVDALLAACHRRCCICHRFCGVKIETDHITPDAEKGPDTIENAIPVCFECHAEIHSYNDRHPRGRKFRAEELRRHKDQWLQICKERPEILVNASRDADVGPIQALIDELELNCKVAQCTGTAEQGCPFQDEQFRRAIREGSIATLNTRLKELVLDAYVAIGRANEHISAVMAQEVMRSPWSAALRQASASISKAKPKVEAARDELLSFMSSDKHRQKLVRQDHQLGRCKDDEQGEQQLRGSRIGREKEG